MAAASCPSSPSAAQADALSPAMPVVRLFASTPPSRLRRPSSPLRTNVTLNIRGSPNGTRQPGTASKEDPPSRASSPSAAARQRGERGGAAAVAVGRSRSAKENRPASDRAAVGRNVAHAEPASPAQADVRQQGGHGDVTSSILQEQLHKVLHGLFCI